MHGVSGARAHGVSRDLTQGPVRTGSPGTSSVAALALHLGSRGLGVVLLLLGDAPEPLGGVPLRT